MKQEIILSTPLKINGVNEKTLTYDTDEITAEQFAEAESSNTRAGGNKPKAGIAETDYGFHLRLGFAAIIAVNPDIDITDLERIKGKDLAEVMRIGRSFFTPASEEHSEEEPYGEQSETIQEPLALQQEN